MIRSSTGLAGGVGETHQMCGAILGAVQAIGLRHGRIDRTVSRQPAVVAFVSAALGVGGGFLLVPYLASWLGLPMFVVAGTSALAVLVASLVSVGNYLYLGVRLDWLLAAVEVVGVLLGSLVGPWVSRHMREQWLRLALAFVLAYIGVAYTLPGTLGWWLGV